MVNRVLSQPAPGWVAPGGRFYAVGDVHGCDDRLAALHRAIADDLRARPVARPLLVHLGDYIDRGPHSARVVHRVAHTPVPGVPTVNLRGNHEQMMLDALTGDPASVRHWLDNHGGTTLRSWNCSPASSPAAWRAGLPAKDVAVLNGLGWYHQADGYLFVHAGLQPGLALAEQTAEDLLWIREAFFDHHAPVLPGLTVVHGHTPVDRPVVTPWRIGIDTGAVSGGKLTCAVLEGRELRFLQV